MVPLFLGKGWHEIEPQEVMPPSNRDHASLLSFLPLLSFSKPTTQFRNKNDYPHPRSTNPIGISRRCPETSMISHWHDFNRDSPPLMGTATEANDRIHMVGDW